MKQSVKAITLFSLVFFTPSRPIIKQLLTDIAEITHALDVMNEQNRATALSVVKTISNKALKRDGVTRGIQFDSDLEDDDSNNKESRNRPAIAGKIPEDIQDLILFLNDDESLERLGAELPKGFLLVGPPGNGKTTLARFIASQTPQASFFDASGSQFIDTYVGIGPKKVRELFEKARASLRSGYKKAFIFIDEIDAIGCSRSFENNSEYRNTLTELLNQMDGFKKEKNIIILAATNNAESLDPALKRPGRFDRIIQIPMPDLEDRKAVLKYYAYSIKHSLSDDNFTELAERTAGFSKAELKELVNEAAMLGVRERAYSITCSHFQQAFSKAVVRKKLAR